MNFEIIWQLQEKEWEKARQARQQHSPGSDYDNTLTPLYDLLYGPVQMVYGSQRLFPKWEKSATDGLRMPILDFAIGLHQILQTTNFEQATRETRAQYTSHEQRLTFTASRREDHVEFSVDESHAQSLTLPPAIFVQGIRDFLQSFVGQIKDIVPEILEWESLAPLRADIY